jgi:hypothetical protein
MFVMIKVLNRDNMRIFGLIFCLFSTIMLSSCTILVGEKAKDEAFKRANNKAKATGLKVGSACKYVGFIGDNSEKKAVKNGKIGIKMFSVNVGGVLKNCTYVYGR